MHSLTGALRPSTGAEVRSVFRRPTTLALFAYLVAATYLPVLAAAIGQVAPAAEPYVSPVAILLYVPAYLLSILVYDSPWGLENVVYAVEGFLGVSNSGLYYVGLVVTYYLCSVVLVWFGATVRRVVGRHRD
ncbi:hypothetical protein [Haloarcula pellucida]|uniref:Uncharacterized protein n=1 Tax=Haloarcula pellucida TaxID=1427151 RepID=A0A830GIL6_9EURY|nr:hypothetical protein [Halomicroarcula pellucida]MBX0347802.1 hypothetical protein [Halomicroarcula pellucida]GGN90364.1 hypothetical protein GCM10009030_12260 [Halomicroarcula pellucida]